MKGGGGANDTDGKCQGWGGGGANDCNPCE